MLQQILNDWYIHSALRKGDGEEIKQRFRDNPDIWDEARSAMIAFDKIRSKCFISKTHYDFLQQMLKEVADE